MAYVGLSVRRKEDHRLLRGAARFVADVHLPGTLHAAVVRSPHAHARLLRVDTSAARAMDSVWAVLTAADLPGFVRAIPIRQLPMDSMLPFLQAPLATDRVRYAGEPVAVVVASDRYAAEDALERVRVEYEPLPAVVESRAAAEAGAPLLFEQQATNVAAAYTLAHGDVERALREADVVIRERFTTQRHGGVPMETRGLLAWYDGSRERLTLWGGTKVPHFNRAVVAQFLGLPEHAVHFVQTDVGGSFGVRGELYPEDLLVPLLALRTGRPVQWIEDRGEHLRAANHSREQEHELTIGLRRDGTIAGVHDCFWWNMGAYVRTHGATVPHVTAAYLPGPYRIPDYRAEAICVVTNKTPAGTCRGPGLFEGSFVRERVMDLAARELGLDPAEIRRRNLVPPGAMPYEVGTAIHGNKMVYDNGDYPGLLERALARFGYAELRREQARARREGRYLGIGMAFLVEKSGLGPWECARVAVDPSGSVLVVSGIPSVGQGVETVSAQVCADVLGVAPRDVVVRFGDTDLLPHSIGAFASRGMMMGGSAVLQAAERVRDKTLRVAARLLEVDVGDLELRDGTARVRGAPERALTLGQLARALAPTPALKAGLEPGLEAVEYFRQDRVSYAYGAQVALLEVDPETGTVAVLRFAMDYDVGRAINPALVEGQLVGGAVQGLGGALLEELAYDDQGQPLSGTFMDYLVPTAADVPAIDLEVTEEYPSSLNPLGVKSAGEGGTVAVGAALGNAVADALAPLGISITSLPLSPARLRKLMGVILSGQPRSDPQRQPATGPARTTEQPQ
jgi:CO/xanthine dehydrogenase Mo-binding subunit